MKRVFEVQLLLDLGDGALLELLSVSHPTFRVAHVLVETEVLEPIADVFGVPFGERFVRSKEISLIFPLAAPITYRGVNWGSLQPKRAEAVALTPPL